MKTDPEYNPLSISTRVREKIEQKANGCTVQPAPQKTRFTSLPSHENSEGKPLKDEFIELLLNAPSEQKKPSFKEIEPLEEKNLQVKGTKELFFPLNKQEVEEKEKPPFSFTILNTAYGELTAHGVYAGKKLFLKINLLKKLTAKEQDTLAAILKVKLSTELNVPLEVKIGCSAH